MMDLFRGRHKGRKGVSRRQKKKGAATAPFISHYSQSAAPYGVRTHAFDPDG